jgi:tryptophan synthase alpha chain
MNKLDLKLSEINRRGKMGLMAHTVIGYPSLDESFQIVKAIAENGADLIELQIPFSDPLADGPTIMKACEESLSNGTKVKDAFVLMKRVSKAVDTPLLFMCYYNTVFKYGVEKFCRDAALAGASGLIPDMPIDEEYEEHLFKFCKKYGMYNIQVLSSFSPESRLITNAKSAEGFIYVTSRRGTTGARDDLDSGLSKNLKRIRKFFKIPIAVGFGISNKKQIDVVSEDADIAVVGSAVIDIINKSDEKNLIKNVGEFIRSLKVE